MAFLAVVGAVVITAALIYATLYYGSMFLLSDETVWFGLKHYPVQMIVWLLIGVALMVGWGFWIDFLASNITIGFG